MIGPFTALWYVFLAITIGLIVLATVVYRKKERKEKLKFLEICGIGLFIYWLLYKVWLATAKDFEFVFWNELPLHLCNLSMPLAIIGARTDNRICQSICFFQVPIGAVLALIFPSEGFEMARFFTPQGLGYYGTHFLILALGIIIVTTGILKPEIKDVFTSCIALFGISVVVFGINLLMRATVYPEANYLYSFGLPGNFAADMAYSLLPVPLLWELPMFVVMIPVNCIQLLLTKINFAKLFSNKDSMGEERSKT